MGNVISQGACAIGKSLLNAFTRLECCWMGKNGFENIKSTAVLLLEYVQISNMLRVWIENISHLINNACLINSIFSAAGELERLHGNCHLSRAVEKSLLEVFWRLREYCCFRETDFHHKYKQFSLVGVVFYCIVWILTMFTSGNLMKLIKESESHYFKWNIKTASLLQVNLILKSPCELSSFNICWGIVILVWLALPSMF